MSGSSKRTEAAAQAHELRAFTEKKKVIIQFFSLPESL